MSTEKQGASFNPDDASGLFDNARAIIKAIKVDYFTAKNGTKYVNVDVTFAPQGQEPITEHYLLGSTEQWAPNADKSGAIPVTEGGKIWNKSQVFRFVKSLTDAGFPKNLVGQNLRVFEGCDVQVSRVTEEGQTYTDKHGKERDRTTLLVTKLYARPGEAKGKASPAATKTTAVASAPAAAEVTTEHDDYATTLLVDILTEAKSSLPIDKLATPAFMRVTRDKKGVAVRNTVQARLKDAAFLTAVAEQGLITFDGAQVALA